jgi:hypothetical protein
MKKLNAFLMSGALTLSLVGCGATTAPPTAEEKQKMEADMAADMQKMTGQLSEDVHKKGTEAPAEGAAPAEGEAAPEGN